MTLGVVFVHGFTSDDRSLIKLQQAVQALGLPYETPVLSGHGLTYHALRGTRWEHWAQDVRDGYERVRARASRVAVVGFSMGGLLALELAAQPDVDLAAIGALAPALYIAHPLAPIAWLARGWYRFLPMGKSVAYSDPELAAGDDSYSRFATDSFVSFYRASLRIRRLVPRVDAPLLLVHSLRDRVIKPISSQFAFDHVASAEKELIWLQTSGHSLLDDVESATVVERVTNFLVRHATGSGNQSVGH